MLEDVIQDRAVEAKFLNRLTFINLSALYVATQREQQTVPQFLETILAQYTLLLRSSLHRTIIDRSLNRYPISHHRSNPSHLPFTPSLLKMVSPPPLSNPFHVTLLASILPNINLPSTSLVLQYITSKTIIPPRRRSCSSRVCTV